MFDWTPYDIYTFCVCMVVYVLLSGLFIFLFTYLLRLMVRHIRAGLEDKKIWEEYWKNVKKNKVYKKKKTGVLDILLTVVFCCIIFGTFAFSVYASVFEESTLKDKSLFRVVLSASMSQKHAENEYLIENDLNDQFQQFDLILTHRLPDEDELKLYDIVVYEVDDMLIIHRIVGIEERNEKHPNERYFVLQGDNNNVHDRFPVLYSQMRAIYKGQRVPFVGSFVAFLQSPAGYMCILLIIFGLIFIPLMDKKLEIERWKRLRFLLMQRKAKQGSEEYEGMATVVQTAQSPTFIPLPIPYYYDDSPTACCNCDYAPCKRS